jgi:GDPmannose 4,6-dehydratase
MQWLMLQQEIAEGFVIAKGAQYSVRQFDDFAAVEMAYYLSGQAKQKPK